MYAACLGEVDGVRLLGPEQLADGITERVNGPDLFLFGDTRMALGFWLHSKFFPCLGPSSFGHAGSGGSCGFGDVDSGVGFAYVMNRIGAYVSADPRSTGLIDAVKSALG